MTETDGSGPTSEQNPDSAERTYRPPPPLWQPTAPASRTSWLRYAIMGLMVAATLVALLGGEEHLLSTPAEAVAVEIVSRDGLLAHETGPSYRYVVAFSDGSRARYLSAHPYEVGTRVTLLRSRGLLTGRVILSEPRRVDRRPAS